MKAITCYHVHSRELCPVHHFEEGLCWFKNISSNLVTYTRTDTNTTFVLVLILEHILVLTLELVPYLYLLVDGDTPSLVTAHFS